MADIVRYHGCLIIVHTVATRGGDLLGSYEIIPGSPATVSAFAEQAITRLYTVVEACDRRGAAPPLPNREYLVEMAKCEIDFVLEVRF
jgi:hypothetical protein